MPNHQSILETFSLLDVINQEAQFDHYQAQLAAAHQPNPEQNQLICIGSGLGFYGALLVGQYLIDYPDVSVIRFVGTHFYNPSYTLNPSRRNQARLAKEKRGLAFLLQGLVATRRVGTLRSLRFSGMNFPSNWWAQFAQTVLAQHPSIEALSFNTMDLTETLLTTLLPSLSPLQLRTLNLDHNKTLTLTNPQALVDQLSGQKHLDEVSLEDIQTTLDNTQPLRDWVSERSTLSISLSNETQRDHVLQYLSLKNRYASYIPSQIAIMVQQFDEITAKVTAYQAMIASLPDHPIDQEARELIAKLTARMDALPDASIDTLARDQIAALSTRVTTEIGAVDTRAQAINTAWQTALAGVEGTLKQQAQDITALQTADAAITTRVTQNETHITELNTTITHVEAAGASLAAKLEELDRHDIRTVAQLGELAAQVRTLEQRTGAYGSDIAELIRDVDGLLTTTAEQDNRLRALVTTVTSVQNQLGHLPAETWGDDADISPQQQAYVRHFTQLVVRMHMAAMVIATGLIKLTKTGLLGKVGHALDACSGLAPMGSGLAVKMIAYACTAVDEHIMQQRLANVLALGTDPGTVASLAGRLGRRLLSCQGLRNPVEPKRIQQLLSTIGGLVSASTSGHYEDTLMHVFEDSVDGVIEHVLPDAAPQAMEEQADKNAQLLLAAVMSKGLEADNPNQLENRLLLYTLPLMTLAEGAYVRILRLFCDQQAKTGYRCEPKQLSVNPKKRSRFFSALTKSWHHYADETAVAMEEPDRREQMLQAIAETYTQHVPTNGRGKGVFFFKEKQAPHASWCDPVDHFDSTALTIMATVIGR